MRPRIGVIGAGWSGLSAAVRATQAGCEVHLFEMARRPGGRARSSDSPAGRLDNGQHILIGAYREAMAMMRTVGVDVERSLARCPLDLRLPEGTGLALPPSPGRWALVRSVLAVPSWRVRERVALLLAVVRWSAGGFRCPEPWTVEQLTHRLPKAVVHDLIEPLCVAALNTPTTSASGATFLRVMRDAVFGDAGSADLLLPRVPLSLLLAEPAVSWLIERGATVHHGHRAMALAPTAAGWQVDAREFDGVVLAASAREAARLVAPIRPEWSHTAQALDHQPIVTVWLADPALRWPRPMMALRCDAGSPAQFGFDLGALGGPAGCFAFVISGAAGWLERGLAETAHTVLEQARSTFPGAFSGCGVIRHVHAERRATFSCVPGLRRPTVRIARRLCAAGDYVEGPYPATLEGAVRSGIRAFDQLAQVE